jgi:glycosyltransferase involved in cell wall biosynthesis
VPLISIIICTRDRPGLLAVTLDHVAALLPPLRAAWELIVVDNGSDPATATTVANRVGEMPVRLLREPEPGLSHARNRALEAASGDWLVFTDDDVAVPPTWLRSYEAAFEANPDAAFWGGPIRAEVDGMSDDVLAPYRAAVHGALVHLEPDFGPCCQFATGWGFPFGANMAFARRHLDGFRFDPRLGRKPGGPIQIGEETQLIDMLLRTGRHGVWLPENRVIHHTDRKRLRASYLRRFYYQVGWLLAQAEAETVDGASRMRDVVDRIARYRRFDLRWRQPLAERLAALRDRAIDLGYRDGFREARRLDRTGVRKRIAGARHA